MRPNDIENSADLGRYYVKGWVSIDRGGNEYSYPYRLDACNDRECIGMVNGGPDVNYEVTSLAHDYTDFMKQVSLGRPDVGMCSHGINLSYLIASSRREANRGIRMNQLERHFFNQWESKNYNSKVNINQSIWELFNPKYWRIEDAYKAIEKGDRVGVPLSLRTGLLGFRGEKYPRVVYKTQSIGTFDGREVKLLREFEEYQDFFREEMKTEVKIAV